MHMQFTMWLIIFGGAKFHKNHNKPSELILVVLIFVTATPMNEWHCASDSAMCYQIEC